jgi:hypothetical protein
MALNDGSANAPVGSPQLPSLLDSYGASRPAWSVAGVDYHVGVPQGLALKDPATISMAGVSVDTTNHVVTVSGNNVTLDGYDFSGGGGWQVSVEAANTKILDSNFVVGSNNYTPIVGTEQASNLSVSNCTIDGAGHDAGVSGTLFLYSGTNFSIDHSWLKNAGGDTIQQTGGSGSIVIEHNLIQDGGLSPTSHGDFTQFEGGPFTLAMNYNTTVENNGETQGLYTEFISQGQITHNTMLGNQSYFTSIDTQSLTGTLTVQDNYYDPSKAYGFAYEGGSSPLAVLDHNVDMTSGTPATTVPGTPTGTVTGTPTDPSTAPPTDTTAGTPTDTSTGSTADTTTGTPTDTSTAPPTDTTAGTPTHTSTGTPTDTTTGTPTDTVTGSPTDSSDGSTGTATDAPNAPVLVSDSIVHHHAIVSGTADPGTTVQLYEGTTLLGSGTTDGDGNWSVRTSALKAGSHTFTATATDEAGNTSALSDPLDPTVGSHSGSHAQHASTITEPSSSQVNPSGGAQTAGSDGHSGTGSGDTFVFHSNFGHQAGASTAAAAGPDQLQAHNSVFDSFASTLSHAAQSGHDPVSPTGIDTLALKTMKVDASHSHDFHFA